MTDVEAYERACSLWGDGVAWRRAHDRFVVGRWIAIGDCNGHVVVLRTGRHACEVMGEGESWEAAFRDWNRRV